VIKKDKRSELSLRELGKLKACDTGPLTDKFILLSLGDKENNSQIHIVALSG